MRIMARGVIALSWFLVFSLACGLPSEKIYGYEMGCPVVSKTATEVNSFDDRQKTYTDISQNENFDSVSIETVDGNISKLVFIKKFANESSVRTTVPKMIQGLQLEWGGSLDRDFVSNSFAYEQRVRDDILHTITVKAHDALTYEMSYISKKYVEYTKDAMMRRQSF